MNDQIMLELVQLVAALRSFVRSYDFTVTFITEINLFCSIVEYEIYLYRKGASL